MNHSVNIPEPLTDREHEILTLMAEGQTNREIAARLFLTYRTVKWYNTQIYGKLGVNNRDEALHRAQVLGLLDEPAKEMLTFVRHNLPVQPTPFIGRVSELEQFTHLLLDVSVRLVTILAPGGMGKTRFALEIARQQIPHFADGVFFIPLAPLTSPDDIVTTIAEHVGFSFYGSESPKQQLLDFLRDRNKLLVLDNFEHLLDGVSLIVNILETASDLKIIVTSREKLNITAETVFLLPGLHFPDGETPADALEYDAIQVFMQSALRVGPAFKLQADDLKHLANICRLTAGLPLGIVLAAGWLDVLTLEQIAAEIQKGIDILETELRDVPERQRSIRATFHTTWERLTEPERSVFMKLSVFRGGFTAEAAQIVAGANLRLLRKLADKALVHILPTGRYDIHELLRQYSQEHLKEAHEEEGQRQKHSDYYLNFLAEREEDVKGRRQQQALQEIRDDFGNIRHAWLWAAEQQRYSAIAQALNCLTIAFEMNMKVIDAHVMLQYAKSRLQPHWVRDAVSIRIGRYSYMLGVLPDENELYEILKRLKAANNESELAWCYWVLGDYQSMHPDPERYIEYREKWLSLNRKLNDAYSLAHSLMAISVGYLAQNESERAIECLHESIQIRRRIGDQKHLPLSFLLLATQLIDTGLLNEGEDYLNQALEMMQKSGHVPIMPLCQLSLALLRFWRGELVAAERMVTEATMIARNQNYVGTLDVAQSISSYFLSLSGDYLSARDICAEIRWRPQMPMITRRAEWGYALAACGLGDVEAARQALKNVLRIAIEHTKSKTDQQMCLPIWAVLEARQQPERAVELIGLTFNAPPALTGWLGHWPLFTRLRIELEENLRSETYTLAWQRGASLELDVVVAEFLGEAR